MKKKWTPGKGWVITSKEEKGNPIKSKEQPSQDKTPETKTKEEKSDSDN